MYAESDYRIYAGSFQGGFFQGSYCTFWYIYICLGYAMDLLRYEAVFLCLDLEKPEVMTMAQIAVDDQTFTYEGGVDAVLENVTFL